MYIYKCICTGLKKHVFSLHSIMLYLLPPEAMKMHQPIMSWFVLKKVFLFQVVFDAKGPLHRVCDCFSFISCHLRYDNTAFFHWCSLLSENTCFLSIYAVQSLFERLSLYISLWNICFICFRVTLMNSSWHDYEWLNWGGRIREFIRWKI